MAERCPICNELECAHSADEKELVKLRNTVKMLEGAIEGWRSVFAQAEKERDEARAAGWAEAIAALNSEEAVHVFPDGDGFKILKGGHVGPTLFGGSAWARWLETKKPAATTCHVDAKPLELRVQVVKVGDREWVPVEDVRRMAAEVDKRIESYQEKLKDIARHVEFMRFDERRHTEVGKEKVAWAKLNGPLSAIERALGVKEPLASTAKAQVGGTDV